jgi:hypothetical protein
VGTSGSDYGSSEAGMAVQDNAFDCGLYTCFAGEHEMQEALQASPMLDTTFNFGPKMGPGRSAALRARFVALLLQEGDFQSYSRRRRSKRGGRATSNWQLATA